MKKKSVDFPFGKRNSSRFILGEKMIFPLLHLCFKALNEGNGDKEPIEKNETEKNI